MELIWLVVVEGKMLIFKGLNLREGRESMRVVFRWLEELVIRIL